MASHRWGGGLWKYRPSPAESSSGEWLCTSIPLWTLAVNRSTSVERYCCRRDTSRSRIETYSQSKVDEPWVGGPCGLTGYRSRNFDIRKGRPFAKSKRGSECLSVDSGSDNSDGSECLAVEEGSRTSAVAGLDSCVADGRWAPLGDREAGWASVTDDEPWSTISLISNRRFIDAQLSCLVYMIEKESRLLEWGSIRGARLRSAERVWTVGGLWGLLGGTEKVEHS